MSGLPKMKGQGVKTSLLQAIPKTHGQRPPNGSADGILFLLYSDTESKAAIEFIQTAANQVCDTVHLARRFCAK